MCLSIKKEISQFRCFLKTFVENIGHELYLEKMGMFIQARTKAKTQMQNTHVHQKDPVRRMQDLETYWKV